MIPPSRLLPNLPCRHTTQTDILDPTRQATQQTTSKLQRPQHYLSGSPGANGGEVDHGADENRDEAFARLNKALRIKNAKIEVSTE